MIDGRALLDLQDELGALERLRKALDIDVECDFSRFDCQEDAAESELLLSAPARTGPSHAAARRAEALAVEPELAAHLTLLRGASENKVDPDRLSRAADPLDRSAGGPEALG